MWYYINEGTCSNPYKNKKSAVDGLVSVVGPVKCSGREEPGVYLYNKKYYVVDDMSKATKLVRKTEDNAPKNLDDIPTMSLEDELYSLVNRAMDNNTLEKRESLGSQFQKGFSEGTYIIAKAVKDILDKQLG